MKKYFSLPFLSISIFLFFSSLFIFLLPFRLSHFEKSLNSSILGKSLLISDYLLYKYVPELKMTDVSWFCEHRDDYKDEINYKYISDDDLDKLCSLSNNSVSFMKKKFVEYYISKNLPVIFEKIEQYTNKTFLIAFILLILAIFLFSLSLLLNYLFVDKTEFFLVLLFNLFLSFVINFFAFLFLFILFKHILISLILSFVQDVDAIFLSLLSWLVSLIFESVSFIFIVIFLLNIIFAVLSILVYLYCKRN